eukprot:1969349-Heterocapsa_arctica.AAC.1
MPRGRDLICMCSLFSCTASNCSSQSVAGWPAVALYSSVRAVSIDLGRPNANDILLLASVQTLGDLLGSCPFLCIMREQFSASSPGK